MAKKLFAQSTKNVSPEWSGTKMPACAYLEQCAILHAQTAKILTRELFASVSTNQSLMTFLDVNLQKSDPSVRNRIF